MLNLRLFPKHTGIWEGTYIRINAEGQVTNQWKSRLTIKLYDDNKYHQANHYMWDDGHEELHDFGVSSFDETGTLIFDSPRIEGYSWETRDSVCLIWTYKNRPGSKLFEMIDLIGDGTHRVRNWRWTEGDEFQGITMINERKVATQDEIPASFWKELPERRFKGQSRSDH
ncbi:MAG: DUF3598 family protein [Saprospiraceae bacterium]|jgi:hypothetical protein|nr:DUF3598 family protein [Saprospiraceae bacterium]MBK9564235.1 DUF3598 family protein [Saprospiraceae bacterium]